MSSLKQRLDTLCVLEQRWTYRSPAWPGGPTALVGPIPAPCRGDMGPAVSLSHHCGYSDLPLPPASVSVVETWGSQGAGRGPSCDSPFLWLAGRGQKTPAWGEFQNNPSPHGQVPLLLVLGACHCCGCSSLATCPPHAPTQHVQCHQHGLLGLAPLPEPELPSELLGQ